MVHMFTYPNKTHQNLLSQAGNKEMQPQSLSPQPCMHQVNTLATDLQWTQNSGELGQKTVHKNFTILVSSRYNQEYKNVL